MYYIQTIGTNTVKERGVRVIYERYMQGQQAGLCKKCLLREG